MKHAIIILTILLIVLSSQVYAQSGIWTTKASMPTARNDLAADVVNGVLYAVGGKTANNCSGLTTLEAYDPSTNAWTTKAPSPIGRYGPAAVGIGGRLYVIGGDNNCSGQGFTELDAYDPVSNSWSIRSSIPTSAGNSVAAATVSGLLYAIGNNGTVQAYDPTTNTWATKAPMPTPLSPLLAGAINGFIYVVGVNGGATLDSVEAYNPATNAWTSKAPPPTGRYQPAGGVVNGNLYVVGGLLLGVGTPLTTVDAYDPATDSWTSVASTPTARQRFAVGVVNGILFAVGGGPDNSVVGTNEAFTAAMNTSPGNIVGTVSVSGGGLAGVTVKLLDPNGFPVTGIDPTTTNAQGQYSFTSVSPGDYQVMIVEPLGYTADQSPKPTTLASGATNTVNFALSQTVVSNTARSKGYWKHQFDVYVTGRGSAQESQAQLNDYIAGVDIHYTPHFSVFAGKTTFADWQGVLTASRNATILDRAKEQLAALVLNLVSLKIGQYTAVSADSRTAGDVLTYVSTLVTDGDNTNDELAKNLAEKVNTQQSIGAGIIPVGTILYKGEGPPYIVWGFGVPKDYTLSQNYPNPFNPSTVMKYELPVQSKVTLRIYNLLGQVAATLVDEVQEAGYKSEEWNASGFSSGVYFYKLQAGSFTETKKLLLMK